MEYINQKESLDTISNLLDFLSISEENIDYINKYIQTYNVGKTDPTFVDLKGLLDIQLNDDDKIINIIDFFNSLGIYIRKNSHEYNNEIDRRYNNTNYLYRDIYFIPLAIKHISVTNDYYTISETKKKISVEQFYRYLRYFDKKSGKSVVNINDMLPYFTDKNTKDLEPELIDALVINGINPQLYIKIRDIIHYIHKNSFGVSFDIHKDKDIIFIYKIAKDDLISNKTCKEIVSNHHDLQKKLNTKVEYIIATLNNLTFNSNDLDTILSILEKIDFNNLNGKDKELVSLYMNKIILNFNKELDEIKAFFLNLENNKHNHNIDPNDKLSNSIHYMSFIIKYISFMEDKESSIKDTYLSLFKTDFNKNISSLNSKLIDLFDSHILPKYLGKSIRYDIDQKLNFSSWSENSNIIFTFVSFFDTIKDWNQFEKLTNIDFFIKFISDEKIIKELEDLHESLNKTFSLGILYEILLILKLDINIIDTVEQKIIDKFTKEFQYNINIINNIDNIQSSNNMDSYILNYVHIFEYFAKTNKNFINTPTVQKILLKLYNNILKEIGLNIENNLSRLNDLNLDIETYISDYSYLLNALYSSIGNISDSDTRNNLVEIYGLVEKSFQGIHKKYLDSLEGIIGKVNNVHRHGTEIPIRYISRIMNIVDWHNVAESNIGVTTKNTVVYDKDENKYFILNKKNADDSKDNKKREITSLINGFITVSNIDNPLLLKSMSLDDFLEYLDQDKIDEIIDIIKSTYNNEEDNKDILIEFDLPIDRPIGYIKMIPGVYDEIISYALPHSIQLQKALQNRYPQLVNNSFEFTNNPKDYLTKSIEDGFNKGQKDFFIDIYTHGDIEGFHIGIEDALFTAYDLIEIISDEKYNDCKFYINTMACFGGGFREDIIDIMRENPKLKNSIYAFLQTQPDMPNIISRYDNNATTNSNSLSGRNYSTLFSLVFTYGISLPENNTFGKILEYTNRKVKEMVYLDPEYIIDGKVVLNYDSILQYLQSKS